MYKLINSASLLRIFVIGTTLCSLYVTWKTYDFFLNEKKNIIRASKFQLVDNNDIVRAELQTSKHKAAELLMYDETGKHILLSIRASHYSTEVLLTNDAAHGIITLTTTVDGDTILHMQPLDGQTFRVSR